MLVVGSAQVRTLRKLVPRELLASGPLVEACGDMVRGEATS